jgi:hypothetical protein
LSFLMRGPMRKYHPIPAATVAAAMVAAAAAAPKRDEGSDNEPRCFAYHYDEMVRLAGEN